MKEILEGQLGEAEIAVPVFSTPTITGFRPRFPGLVLSVLFHTALVCLLPFLSESLGELDRIIRKDVEDQLDRQNRKKLTWFRIQSLPPVQPSDNQSLHEVARGRIKSDVEVVVERKDAPTGRQ